MPLARWRSPVSDGKIFWLYIFLGFTCHAILGYIYDKFIEMRLCGFIRWAFRPDEERDESVVAEERDVASAAAAAAATAEEVSTFIEQQPYDATHILADNDTNNRRGRASSSATSVSAAGAATHGTTKRNQVNENKEGDTTSSDDAWDHQQSPLGRLSTEELTALIQRNRVRQVYLLASILLIAHLHARTR